MAHIYTKIAKIIAGTQGERERKKLYKRDKPFLSLYIYKTTASLPAKQDSLRLPYDSPRSPCVPLSYPLAASSTPLQRTP
nr:MAG TPA: hypothetical protein [Caudoviricetes sp.]